ncbi:MAG: sigma 54-interacting transcriptional regulator [Kofleriaceae bacterium]|nr:sigma 54-interacting transcriptional regulator [Kofleriaceae bacterium]MBP6836479.1 sigma 54-interacting transcriptional regulator [Kofleriaceae bacterium]MBP9206769.1 sigma 54-interacting transcriptional regulator [Kofleriaceae bacterium]
MTRGGGSSGGGSGDRDTRPPVLAERRSNIEGVTTSRDVEVPEPSQEGLSLLVVGDGIYATHSLPPGGSALIGRSAEVDIRIDDPSISRQHAVIHVAPLRIEDLGSANGTWARDSRVPPNRPFEIRVNEAVRLGSVTVIAQQRVPVVRTRRLRTHDYFDSRVEDECARANRNGGNFVIAHLVLERDLGAELHEVFARCLRESDVVASYAPNEYELLLVDTSPTQAERVIGRLTLAVNNRGGTHRLGQAWFPRDGRDASTLCAHARARAHGQSPREVDPAHIVVADDKMKALHELVTRVAGGDISVLLLGETGVGKEVIAEAIHRQSSRATRPFLRLNCSALTETLLESELFGHERGAFTGATHSKPGLLEVAEGGIVFLDEIGELQMSTQVKLLRVLDERKVLRVGGLKPRPIDVRFLSATNRDLELEVRRGNFRLDLLYRLNAMSIVVPPLRERISEIEPMARYFARTIATGQGRPTPTFGDDALALLRQYAWPGNVRELRNIIERALILCNGEIIWARDLPEEKMRSTYTTELGGGMPVDMSGRIPIPSIPTSFPGMPIPGLGRGADVSPALGVPVPGVDSSGAGPTRAGGADAERARILAALEQCAGNQTHAARLLGISRRTLINRLEKFAVPRPRKGRD